LLLTEARYSECIALFQEYQKTKSKYEGASLIAYFLYKSSLKKYRLKDCEYAFGAVVLALTKELTINPHNISAIKSLKELGFIKKAALAYLTGMSKILKLKLKEYMLINDSYKKQEEICTVFLKFVSETKKHFESNFDIGKEDRPVLAFLTKWILDELRKFALILTEILFKTRTIQELRISQGFLEKYRRIYTISNKNV